ncbi:hypothetical protein MY1884_004677 [Beauveria asiatica]
MAGSLGAAAVTAGMPVAMHHGRMLGRMSAST